MQVYVLWTEASKHEHAPAYKFAGANRVIDWPIRDGAGMGRAGAFNAFLRLGWKPVLLRPNDLPAPCVGDLLVVCESGELADDAIKGVTDWMAAGGKVIASGPSRSWVRFVPGVTLDVRYMANPYSGIAHVYGSDSIELVAPVRWPYFAVTGGDGIARMIGQIGEVHGERQSPSRARVSRCDSAPALIQINGFHLLNADPFGALQSWIQGQEDLQPWLGWRHRLFWLDEYVAYIRSALVRLGALSACQTGPGIPGLGSNTIVLRHDLDDSRDTTYLDLEHKHGIAGVHAILKDRNTSFWLTQLNSRSDQESAFHYNTAHYSRIENWMRSRLLGLPQKPYLPKKSEIAGSGLLKQVRWAKRKGIGVSTLHRHLSFIYYPEYIEALDTVFRCEPGVLGGSSYYRGQLLRWGIDRPDGARGTVAEFPDPFFPYWLPFKLAHGGDSGRLLRGWESTSMMEVEPELLAQMLDHSIPDIPQRVITLNYHPAHANGTTFAPEGCKAWFRGVLDIISDRRVAVVTLRDVMQSLNAYVGEGPPISEPGVPRSNPATVDCPVVRVDRY